MKRKTSLILAAALAAIVAYTALSRSQFVSPKTAPSALAEENASSEQASAAEVISQLSSEEPVQSAPPSSEVPAPSSQISEKPAAELPAAAAPDSESPAEPKQENTAAPQQQKSGSTESPPAAAEADTPKPAEQPVQTPGTKTASEAVSYPPADFSFAGEVIRLVNIERAKAGLAALAEDTGLDKTANIKARDMVTNDYFAHVSPSGVSPFDLMKANGIRYQYAGENIAMGYSTPASVMEAWMNSEGHRKNILSADYTRIGIGIFQDTNGAYYWVQHFAG